MDALEAVGAGTRGAALWSFDAAVEYDDGHTPIAKAFDFDRLHVVQCRFSR
jgi:hypothetical protein